MATARHDCTWPQATPLGPYGVPLDQFARAWDIDDIRAYTGLKRTAAWDLMRRADAPARLHTGRLARWNALEVLNFLHAETPEAPTMAVHLTPSRESANIAVDRQSASGRADRQANVVIDPADVHGHDSLRRQAEIAAKPPAPPKDPKPRRKSRGA